MTAGEILKFDDVEALRPAPVGALEPYRLAEALGRALREAKPKGAAVTLADLTERV